MIEVSDIQLIQRSSPAGFACLYTNGRFQTQTRFKSCWWPLVSASLIIPFGRNVQFGAAEDSHLLLITNIDSKDIFDFEVVPMAGSMERSIRPFKNIQLSWGFRLDDGANATLSMFRTVSVHRCPPKMRLSLGKIPFAFVLYTCHSAGVTHGIITSWRTYPFGRECLPEEWQVSHIPNFRYAQNLYFAFCIYGLASPRLWRYGKIWHFDSVMNPAPRWQRVVS